jgi:putative colanic acid biosynthesis acetyltransferase WcaF
MQERSCLSHDVDCYSVAKVTLGVRSVVSQYAFLCTATHSYSDLSMPLESRAIEIQEDAWVAAGAFVGPGVTVHTGAVVGAFAVVTHSVEPWSVVAGNPAQFVKRRPRLSTGSKDEAVGG